MDQELEIALKRRRKKYTMVTAERKYCIPWKAMYTFVSITDKLKKPTECHKIQRLFLFFIISSLQMKFNPILVTKVYLSFREYAEYP